jgi:ectoine hydroxylase-related dioxygenase (phytanoyl-CoA dioxygenase family)
VAEENMAPPSAATLAYTKPETLVRDFASRGLVVLAPEDLGIPTDIHDVIYEKEKAAFSARRYITASVIPEILDVIDSPGVVAACDRLVGKNWAIVPFTHNTPYVSGSNDQHWHKDDNGPYNGRRHRHHHAVQVEMLYYPQAVAPDAGPTATVPYSQYWALNHEENHDNFAGADHLDFGYQVGGMERLPVSGPNSTYDIDDIVNRRTAHDIRMREAVANTGWPLVAPFEACPLKAGSVVLYSHNMYHRGNHRRDDWRRWKTEPRFMWRFWLYRTTEPDGDAPQEVDWRGLGIDPLTGLDYAEATDDATTVWRHHHHWMHTGKPAPRRRRDPAHLTAQLHTWHDAGEPLRIGAAYKLAEIGSAQAIDILGRALHSERETLRRAALYGLIALGPAAAHVLLEACDSPVKWVRRAALCGLGDAAPLTDAVLAAVSERLRTDTSVYVRSVAATALGGIARRAIGSGVGTCRVPACAEALVASLAREPNRLGMNIAQRRNIKFVRPTDACDVCEGIGINYSVERFKRVRSAVRENALWSLVILCSHGTAAFGDALPATVDALASVVREDDNVFCVGSALDALARLANLGEDDAGCPSRVKADALLRTLLREMPIHSWEPLLRSGVTRQAIDAHRRGEAEIARP